jgi:hypothetical protein
MYSGVTLVAASAVKHLHVAVDRERIYWGRDGSCARTRKKLIFVESP